MRTSILGIIVSAAVGSFAFFGGASLAEAQTVVITGTGVWGPDTPVLKKWTAPGATFLFSFELPNPIPSNPTAGTGFDYTLNDKGSIDTVLSPNIDVQFFPVGAQMGLFDVLANDGNVLSVYGEDVGTSLTILPGTYSATLSMNDAFPITGTGTVIVDPIGVGVTGFPLGVGVTSFGRGVPESSTWVMMTLGFAGLAFAGYRNSRKSAMVAQSV